MVVVVGGEVEVGEVVVAEAVEAHRLHATCSTQDIRAYIYVHTHVVNIRARRDLG